MTIFLSLLLALLIDRIFGEPERVWAKYPHPVALMGQAIDWFDTRLNQDDKRRAKGVVTVLVLVLGAGLIGLVIEILPLWGIPEMLIAAVLIAHKSLIEHVAQVGTALKSSIGEARKAVALIVGRDTGSMNSSDVSRAAIESAAENFSDGVIAPAFWFLVAGLPGLMIYKIVNTADSMIGYRSEKYENFGWAAARLDDVLNYVPARLTAGLVALAHGDYRAWEIVQTDAVLHRSPNAGWPEAAVAGVMNVALSGPRVYDGELTDDPFVNPAGKLTLDFNDIDNVIGVLNRSWAVLVGLLAIPSLVWLIL